MYIYIYIERERERDILEEHPRREEDWGELRTGSPGSDGVPFSASGPPSRSSNNNNNDDDYVPTEAWPRPNGLQLRPQRPGASPSFGGGPRSLGKTRRRSGPRDPLDPLQCCTSANMTPGPAILVLRIHKTCPSPPKPPTGGSPSQERAGAKGRERQVPGPRGTP